MKNDLYPKIKVPKIRPHIIRKIVAAVFMFYFFLALGLNIYLGGKPWCLYVLFSQWVLYKSYVTWDLVENNFISRWFSVVFPVCALLLTVQMIETSVRWASTIVVPLLYLISLLILCIVFICKFESQKSALLPIIKITSGSFLALLVGVFIIGNISFFNLIFIFSSTLIVTAGIIWFRKPLAAELKKKFHS
ncbi:MAG: DUF6320 domain-containing protein [Clostridia bacterium]